MGRRACRRCNRIPRWDDAFHRGFGAVSRTDEKSRICNDCGVSESLEDFFDGKVTPQDEWPVET